MGTTDQVKGRWEGGKVHLRLRLRGQGVEDPSQHHLSAVPECTKPQAITEDPEHAQKAVRQQCVD